MFTTIGMKKLECGKLKQLKMIVDSREPQKYYDFCVKSFKNVDFTYEVQKEGDYNTDKIICERKTIGDLYNSIVDGRFISQLNRMAVHDKIKVLLIAGDIRDYCSKRRKRGYKCNEAMLYGAIAMAAYRYGFHIIWAEDTEKCIKTYVPFAQKVEEGEYMVPTKAFPETLLARYLGVSTQIMDEMITEYGTVYKMAQATEKDLCKIKGIGDSRAKQIRKRLKEAIK